MSLLQRAGQKQALMFESHLQEMILGLLILLILKVCLWYFQRSFFYPLHLELGADSTQTC